MDAVVMQAMAKWPDVPHCYGWLALDARGNWRMRDERAQSENLPGDRIAHEALLGFINRNYASDERGCWYFQNGPQRVYVTLEITPFVARSDPQRGFLLQTGAAIESLDAAWMTPEGGLILSGEKVTAAVDDRDVAACLDKLQLRSMPVDDDRLMAWLSNPRDDAPLTFKWEGLYLPVARIERSALGTTFGFVANPQAPLA